MFRHARFGDRDELYEMWQYCFGDSDAFAGWFFTERFLPEYCAVWEEGGRIACAAHSLPVHLRVRGSIMPAAVIAGVATLPEYRWRGIMRAMLTEQLRFLRSAGLPIVIYRPVDFAIYRSLQHYPVADKTFLTLPSSAPRPCRVPGVVTQIIDAGRTLDALYSVYARVSVRYSGSIARSYADFAYKYRDYASDGICCAAAFRDDSIAGYCFYSDDDGTVEGVEIFADDTEIYSALISCVANAVGSRNITLALPPDVCAEDSKNNPRSFIVPDGASVRTVARTAAGVTDVQALLRATGQRGFAIEVRDNVLSENSGVYDISGACTDEHARIKLDAGRLAQLVFGYMAAGELVSRGEASVTDPAAAAELDALLPLQSCYSADEY
jgi:predicted acetyltransferase